MDDLYLTHAPIARTGMLIHRPALEVYGAFVDPAITTHFWFTRSSGKLEAGRQARWEWEMYGVSTLVEVKVLQPARLIRLDWDLEREPTQVEWTFTPRSANSTFVEITNSGFSGNGDKIVEQAMGSESGFALVLAGLKAYLEHGIELHLVADRFPDLSAGLQPSEK